MHTKVLLDTRTRALSLIKEYWEVYKDCGSGKKDLQEELMIS